MAPIKRKRPQIEPEEAPEPKVTRRATRRTPVPAPGGVAGVGGGGGGGGAAVEPGKRRGRTVVKSGPEPAETAASAPKVTAIPPPKVPPMTGSSSTATAHANTQTQARGVGLKEGRSTRRRDHDSKENVRPEADSEGSAAVGRSSRLESRQPARTQPQAQPSPAPPSPQMQRLEAKEASRQQPSKSSKRRSSSPDRNIDKVVLGNICFRAWYPSYYGKEVVGDASGSKNDGAKTSSRRDREGSPVLDRLYVCPCCFKYSKELVMWWEHVRVCEAKCFVPGRRIYVHPRREGTVLVPVEVNKGGRRREGKVEVVRDEGEWSIWEVDGEKDVLFCQNLSLFAKLFLDNKSVFFDVTGFKYYLLVFSQPNTPSSSASPDSPPIRHHICGFFSKEKLSWDNNNLACILIFPPWQRKGLGSLLMGVSYEISKREGILGGPEKPISELGRKGYRRFWAGEVARWILGLDLSKPTIYIPPPPEPSEDEEETNDKQKEKAPTPTPAPEPPKQSQPEPHLSPPADPEFIIDVSDCSRATWITPEDCLSVLREMGVAEDGGVGLGKVEVGPDGEMKPPRECQRVRIRREGVRNWIREQGISLERTCDPEGFVKGYAMPKVLEVKGE